MKGRALEFLQEGPPSLPGCFEHTTLAHISCIFHFMLYLMINEPQKKNTQRRMLSPLFTACSAGWTKTRRSEEERVEPEPESQGVWSRSGLVAPPFVTSQRANTERVTRGERRTQTMFSFRPWFFPLGQGWENYGPGGQMRPSKLLNLTQRT